MTVFPNIHGIKKSSYKKCVNGFIPKTVLIPLRQDFGPECNLLVKEGESVKEGQLIAQSSWENGKNMSCVYSPIPGIVTGKELCVCPDGKMSHAVRIKLGGSFSFLGKKKNPLDITLLRQNELIQEIAIKGIVNTFTAQEPTLLSDDISKAVEKKAKLLVVRLFDEDSSRYTDSLLANFYTAEIFEGAKIALKALNGDGIIFVTEKDFVKPENLSLKVPCFFVQAKTRLYPSGYKNQLIFLIKSQVKDETFSKVSRNSLFTDSSTMLELSRTINSGFPSIDRYVLVGGECLNVSGLIKVVHGTSFRDLAEQCGGLVKRPGTILVNGYVSGFSTITLDTPVTKYVKSVTFLPESKVPDQRMSVCIHCGACRRVCPEKLSPDLVYSRLKQIENLPEIYEKSRVFCIDCSLCNSVCPSRLPLSQTIYKKQENKVKQNISTAGKETEETVSQTVSPSVENSIIKEKKIEK